MKVCVYHPDTTYRPEDPILLIPPIHKCLVPMVDWKGGDGSVKPCQPWYVVNSSLAIVSCCLSRFLNLPHRSWPIESTFEWKGDESFWDKGSLEEVLTEEVGLQRGLQRGGDWEADKEKGLITQLYVFAFGFLFVNRQIVKYKRHSGAIC